MAKIIVSACLLGENCRYDGGNCRNKKVIAYLKDKEFIAVCPEQMAGLSTPRLPCEVVADRVINIDGKDLTADFDSAAAAVLAIAKKHQVKLAILKSESPSCGRDFIFDGSFTGRLVANHGVTANLLLNNNIRVISEKEITKELKKQK